MEDRMRKGFTLIEIIIVIVILGVLATLALPKLSGQIAAADAAEAMMSFGSIKRAVMSCYDTLGNFSGCATQSAIGVDVGRNVKFDMWGTNGPTAASTYITVAACVSATGQCIEMQVNNAGRTRFSTPVTSPFIGVVSKTGSTTVFDATVISAGVPF
jgi:prepilin-type N-terminal cleavage/methylation domain-containing protein